MQRVLVPDRGSIKILGPSWRAARSKLIEYISDGYQLISIVGRAGVGKTTLLLSLNNTGRGVFLYADMTEVPDKGLSGIMATLIADNIDRVIEIQRKLKHAGAKGLLRAFAKAGVDEVVESARLKPLETLKLLNDAVELLGLEPLVLGVDEGLVSQEDPRAMNFIDALHAFRNNMQLLRKTHLVVTLLPDVVNMIAKVDTPLFDVMRIASITLPDYVAQEDLKEIASEYGLPPEEVRKIMNLGPLTMRQVICLVNTKVDVVKCGVDTADEITIEG
ncbi:ATP-binding protein [Vulcanisaeta thermophila]|uniref:ATP-binding protein n=1 Tax=Vulcanisaeta thermophila TaxID=867917 RepID=UPI000853BCD9|nr:ATP-binding protein [Vulcanisaeta thermophila]